MSVIGFNKYYSFRDDFLLNSSFGQNYIQTFYAVTDHYIAALDLNILSDIVTTLPYINNAIDLLFDSTYQGIIIDETTKDNVLAIINQIKENTDSQIFIDQINSFESDFNALAEKTRIENEINSMP